MRQARWTAVWLVVSIAMGVSNLQGADTMRLIPSHPLAKVLGDSAPTISPTASATTSVKTLLLDGAAGETISAQAVLLAGDAAEVVSAAIGDLIPDDGGASISATAVKLQWVRYLEVSKNTPGIPEDELVARAPTRIPDPFWESAERMVDTKAVQPLWVELTVPAGAKAGVYRGTLTVAGKSERAELPLSLRVRAFVLSPERHQNVIQWWDFPGRGFESLKPGTDEYWQHLERSCAFLRDHRQTDVRVPWDMIGRKTAGDGKIECDTALFEQYADIVFKSGLRAVQFTAVGRHTRHQLLPDSRTDAVENNMDRLAAVQTAVVRRGWQGRVYTSLADEPFIYHEQSYRDLLARVRQIAPAVGVIEAVESEELGDLDIFVPKLSHLNLWLPYYENLNRQGKQVWFYTCCHPVGRYPNRFLDQPLIKARELHWISYLYDLDGYLHWGLNWFKATGDPYNEDVANPWSLPPGDSQVAYPGTTGFLGSLRLSAMRDGLQDYEYLWMLEDRLSKLKQRVGDGARWLDPRQRPLELCRRVVQSCYDHTRDPQVLFATRQAIADEIEALSAAPLLVVQTSPPEGTRTPAGPIMINVRGLTSPGAKVTVNGREVIPQNIGPGGSFIDAQFITAEQPEITVTAELDGRVCTTRRNFQVVE